jgi:MtaA/CmuA family methyltransferase
MTDYSSVNRFQDALKGRPKDRVPVFAGTSLWAASNFPEASFQEIAFDPELIVKAQLWARDAIGFDALYPIADPLTIAEAFGCKVRFPETGPLVDPLTIPLDSPEAVDRMGSPDPVKSGRLPVVLEAVRGLKEKSRGEALVVGLFEGAFTNTCRIIEAERVLRMIYKRPEVLDLLLDKVNGFLMEFGAALKAHGADIFYIPDPTSSSTMISPRMFARWVLPRLQRLIQSLNAPVILHICGDTKPILTAMAQTGAGVLSLDQCMDLAEARKSAPGLALAGNVEPVRSLLMGGPEAVRSDAIRCLRSAGTERFILMPGCAVPPRTPVENLRAMVDAATEFGLGD